MLHNRMPKKYECMTAAIARIVRLLGLQFQISYIYLDWQGNLKTLLTDYVGDTIMHQRTQVAMSAVVLIKLQDSVIEMSNVLL